jgi:Bacterial dnaA protein helix-turn-helix
LQKIGDDVGNKSQKGSPMPSLEILNSSAPRPPAHRQRRRPNDRTARLCSSMESAVAAAFRVPVRELRAPTRGSAAAAFARQIAMYLAHVVLRQSYSAVGRLFRRDRTTAAYACALIEERRDDPVIDSVLQTLEEVCTDLARALAAEREARS